MSQAERAMHDEDAAARLMDFAHEVAHEAVAGMLVHADAVLHRHGLVGRILHRPHAGGHRLGLKHQTGAEAALLHALGGTAAVEVVFIVAVSRCDAHGLGQIRRIRAAQLQRYGMLRRRKTEQPITVAVNDRARRHHLGVEAGPARQKPVKVPAVPVGPVQHRATAKRQSSELRGMRVGSVKREKEGKRKS